MAKSYNYSQPGAYVLTARPDSLVGLLDAYLVNGINSVTLDSVVIASNVATGTISTGHKFAVGQTVLIGGATHAGQGVDYTVLNGDQVVTGVSTDKTTFTFATTGLSDASVTGTITAKVSPLGYTKTPTASGHVSAYKASDSAGKQDYLRVDDTNDCYALVRGYATMAGINTGTGPYPSGSVASITITNGGSSYVSAPTITFTPVGGTGSGAAATAHLTGGVVTSITITNGGSGYVTAPTVAFGSGAAAGTAVMTPSTSAAQWFKGAKSDGSTLTISSLVVTNGVAVATTSANHGLITRQRVVVSAATPSGLNGSKSIIVTGPKKFQYTATGISDTSTTGTAIIDASRKWYLYGDSKGFRLLTEIQDGVYSLSEFNDLAPFRSTTKNAALIGWQNGVVKAFSALGGDVAHTLTGRASGTNLLPLTIDMNSVSNVISTGSTQSTLDSSVALDEAHLFIGTGKVATVRGLYIPPYPAEVAYGSGTTAANKPFGAPTDSMVAFSVIAGSPKRVQNIFVQTSGSW